MFVRRRKKSELGTVFTGSEGKLKLYGELRYIFDNDYSNDELAIFSDGTIVKIYCNYETGWFWRFDVEFEGKLFYSLMKGESKGFDDAINFKLGLDSCFVTGVALSGFVPKRPFVNHQFAVKQVSSLVIEQRLKEIKDVR